MLDVIAKLVKGLEILLKGINTVYPRMIQIARVGQNTSNVFNLGLNFEDDLWNFNTLRDLDKLIDLLRERFPSLAPEETDAKKPRLDFMSGWNSKISSNDHFSTFFRDKS